MVTLWWIYGIHPRIPWIGTGKIFTGNHRFSPFSDHGAFRDPDFPLLQPIRWRNRYSPGAVRKSSVDMDVSHRPTHWGYHLSNKYLSDSDLRNSKNRTWRPTQPVENCSFTGKMTENDKKPWDSGSGILGKSTYHSWRFFGKQQCSSDFLQYKWTQNHLVSSNDEMLLVDAWGLYVGKNKSLGMFTFFSNGNRPAWPRARRVWRIAYSQYTRLIWAMDPMDLSWAWLISSIIDRISPGRSIFVDPFRQIPSDTIALRSGQREHS